jgi:hypothetical protein
LPARDFTSGSAASSAFVVGMGIWLLLLGVDA